MVILVYVGVFVSLRVCVWVWGLGAAGYIARPGVCVCESHDRCKFQAELAPVWVAQVRVPAESLIWAHIPGSTRNYQ